MRFFGGYIISKRIAAIFALLCGVTIAWLIAALLFVHLQWSTQLLGLAVLWGIMAWELRWWTDLKFRLPIAIFGGGLLIDALRPQVAYKYTANDWIPHPLDKFGPFSSVNWCLIGAFIFTIVVLMISPMKKTNIEISTELQDDT